MTLCGLDPLLPMMILVVTESGILDVTMAEFVKQTHILITGNAHIDLNLKVA